MYAVSALSGCGFGDVDPATYYEILLTIFIMIIGATAYAKVFSDFDSLMYLFSAEKIENRYFDQSVSICD